MQSRQLLLITKEEVKNSPEYDSSQPINDSYEHSLNDYYENKIIIMEILQEAYLKSQNE
jgi:hypothetical protein